MIIHALPPDRRPEARSPRAATGPSDPVDRLELSPRRKTWRAIGQAGFGAQVAGTALLIMGAGAIGMVLVAAGIGVLVAGEIMYRRS